VNAELRINNILEEVKAKEEDFFSLIQPVLEVVAKQEPIIS